MVMIGVGIKMFPKPLLDIYRRAVVDKKSGTELRRIVKKVSDKGYLVNGKHYKKVPRSFDAEHPNAEFLLYNGLTARIEETIPKAFFFRCNYRLCIFALSNYVANTPMAEESAR
jgi:hypothetical protein